MHPRLSQSHGKLVTAFSLVILAAGMAPASGDDTGILGRLFRLAAVRRTRARATGAPNQSGALPYGRAAGSTGSAVPPAASLSACAGTDDLEL